jgi:hypothetical protein
MITTGRMASTTPKLSSCLERALMLAPVTVTAVGSRDRRSGHGFLCRIFCDRSDWGP